MAKANGQWPMANGQWPMANGQWPMANGQWPMANGQWPMANGQWPSKPELLILDILINIWVYFHQYIHMGSKLRVIISFG